MKRRKHIIGLISALALAGCVAPAAASATERPLEWWYLGTPIRIGTVVEVSTFGHANKITLHLAPSGASLTCNLHLTDAVSDPHEEMPGVDEMVRVTFAKCKQGGAANVCPSSHAEVIAAGMPWASHLEPEYFAPGKATNVIEGVDLELRCRGSSAAATFTGTLRSVVRKQPVRRKQCTVFELPAESSLSGEGATLSLSGVFKMGTCKEGLEARPPIKR